MSDWVPVFLFGLLGLMLLLAPGRFVDQLVRSIRSAHPRPATMATPAEMRRVGLTVVRCMALLFMLFAVVTALTAGG